MAIMLPPGRSYGQLPQCYAETEPFLTLQGQGSKSWNLSLVSLSGCMADRGGR